MKKSIGKKVIFLMGGLGILLVLIVFSFILMVIITVVVKISIANPAKNANAQLTEIVDKIKSNHGDLTERIQTKSNDEIGQLVWGINGFMGQLQSLMQKLQEVSAKMSLSADAVTGQVDESNQSAVSVSAVTQEIAASMEAVATTLEELSRGSEEILQKVHTMDQSAHTGSANMLDIRNRARNMKTKAEQSKKDAIEVFHQVGTSLQQAVGESKSVEQINSLTGNILDEPFWKNTASPFPNSASDSSPVFVASSDGAHVALLIYKSQIFLKLSR